MRQFIAFLGLMWFGLVAMACGGSVANPITQPGDGGADATDGSVGADVVTTTDSTSPPILDAIAPPPEDSPVTVIDAGQACAPPNDPSKAALCITLLPEAITFTSDPDFDGKGELVVQAFDTSTPDLPDGGTVPSLATVTYSGATQVDLSQPVPAIRFDGLPPKTVYARAVFVDPPMPTGNLTAGFWIGGYDLSNGIQNQTKVLPTMLSAGSSTAIAMELVAVRSLTVDLTLAPSTKPAGNGEGPAVFIVTPTQTPSNASALFGVGQSPCARVDGNRTAEVQGFVIGKGPYFVGAVLDDFGGGDGGVSLPPGALTSLELSSGGVQIPGADALTYPANAYQVKGAVTLGLVVGGDAGVDSVSCP